jgi:hypothetical protein
MAVDAVVHVGEVENLAAPVDGDRLAAAKAVDEERDHTPHPAQVVVVAAVDVRKTKDEVAEPVTARVGVDQRLAGDLRRRVGALGESEVRRLLAVALEAMNVAVHLPRGREDERQLLLPAMLEHVERHHRVLERALRLAHELVHLGVRGEMDDDVGRRVLDAADPARERRVRSRRGPAAGTGRRPSTCSSACRRRKRRARRRRASAPDSCRSGRRAP